MTSWLRRIRPDQEFPATNSGCAPRTSPHPPDWSWRHIKRRNNTGSSRIPSRLAHRARPIRQYWTDSTLSRLLPPSPANPGSGCLQLSQAATTTWSWGLSPPTETSSASWRTTRYATCRRPAPTAPSRPRPRDRVQEVSRGRRRPPPQSSAGSGSSAPVRRQAGRLKSPGSEPSRRVWAHPWAQNVHACPASTDTKQQQRSRIPCSVSTGRKALIRNGIRPL